MSILFPRDFEEVIDYDFQPERMYQSPIEVFQTPQETAIRELQNEQENRIIAEISAQLGVAVDKGELIRALQYDRGQYDAGYTDGVKAGRAEVAREIFAELATSYPDEYFTGGIDITREELYELKQKYGVTENG